MSREIRSIFAYIYADDEWERLPVALLAREEWSDTASTVSRDWSLLHGRLNEMTPSLSTCCKVAIVSLYNTECVQNRENKSLFGNISAITGSVMKTDPADNAKIMLRLRSFIQEDERR
ncbi:hypothetical protein DPMN_011602 [Dreissena polymorpha]|uniref:Uncharacterized protein n=1 Tax=Dreissena polymorpha TaxID=45954 RepID=A0A9D4N5E4_DREPO|nr:hypothetical protein DPMN_011602 [Dreissena polymorpha]